MKRSSRPLIVSILVGLLLLTTSISKAQSPSAPILVLYSPLGNGIYGQYVGEILKAEGINSFDMADISSMTPALLAPYRVVILGRSSLNSTQVTNLTNYVNGGGSLVAIRPDAQLNGLAGLVAGAGQQVNGYLKIINNASLDGQTPGSGLTSQTLQLHGSADRFTMGSGTVMLAELYSGASTPTGYPAVIGKVAGAGRVVAFTYDLPLNLIYTRQGNPANANVDVDGDTVFRTTDLFQGTSGGAAYLDLDKVPLPQADEQVRFLGRLVKQLSGMPLPQVWYFPGITKTMLVVTSDAHANPTSYIQLLIDSLNSKGAHSTVYLSQAGEPAYADVQGWRAQGHSFGIHPYDKQPDFVPPITSLAQGYDTFYNWFQMTFDDGMSATVRHHRVVWLGWTDAVDLEASYGIRMDTNYYHWGTWLQRGDGSWARGYITGSGLPMKFVKLDGTITPVYQQATQLTDEQMITGIYTQPGDPLFENLTGAQALQVTRDMIDASQAGFYSAFIAQFHVDYYSNEDVRIWAEGTMDYANNQGIPIWNADEWLAFTELRSASSYSNISWNAATGDLSFNLNSSASPAVSLSTLLPVTYAGKTLREVTVDGAPAAFTQSPVKGRQTAFVTVPAGNHSFTARYLPVADLVITKGGAPDPVVAGQPLTYTMNITNSGPDSADAVTVSDALPAGVSLVSAVSTQGSCSGTATINCNLGSIASGGAAGVTITVNVSPAQRLALSNTAEVSGQVYDPNPANNSSTSVTGVTASADVSISISDAPDPATAGSGFDYLLTAANAGPSTATGVSITLPLPAGASYAGAAGSGWACTPGSGSLTCNLGGSLGVNAGSNLTVHMLVNADQTGSLAATATLSAAENDANPGNNADSETTSVTRSADLSVTLGDSPDPVIAGTTLTYTLNIQNAGPSTATAITLTQVLPPGVSYVNGSGTGWACTPGSGNVSCSLASLGVGAASTLTVAVTVNPGEHGPLNSSASVGASEPDPASGNNSSSTSTGVSRQADVSLTIADAPDPVAAGGELTYTFTIQNLGPSFAEAVTLTDVLPAEVTYQRYSSADWICGHAGGTFSCDPRQLAPGYSGTIEMVVTVSITQGTLSNQVTVGSSTPDATPANNTAGSTTQVTPLADLKVSLSSSLDPARAGNPLQYTVLVENLGVSVAEAVTLTFQVSPGVAYFGAAGSGWACGISSGLVTCTLPQLGVSPASPVYIDLLVPASGNSLSAEASVQSATTDPVMSNNTSVLTTDIYQVLFMPLVGNNP